MVAGQLLQQLQRLATANVATTDAAYPVANPEVHGQILTEVNVAEAVRNTRRQPGMPSARITLRSRAMHTFLVPIRRLISTDALHRKALRDAIGAQGNILT